MHTKQKKVIQPEVFEVPRELLFMTKKISISGNLIAYWLSIPEFREEMEVKVRNRETIDDATVLPIMQRIYDEKLQLRRSGQKVQFGFSSARHSINQLIRVLND